jgi:hypothetical protein
MRQAATLSRRQEPLRTTSASFVTLVRAGVQARHLDRPIAAVIYRSSQLPLQVSGALRALSIGSGSGMLHDRLAFAEMRQAGDQDESNSVHSVRHLIYKYIASMTALFSEVSLRFG